jgi:hypothetical protein
MENVRFDRFTRDLVRSHVTRRTAVTASLMGLLGVPLARSSAAAQDSATPAAEATPLVVTPDEIQIGDAWLCKQLFGLCTTAPCELDADDPSVANCHCVVVDAYAVGFKTCTERAPSGMSVTSNFSSVNVNSAFSVMTCPEEIAWANCLDMPCEINPLNPATATCQCQMVEQGPSLTWGGGCDTSTCETTVWSAAPTSYLGLEQYIEGMQAANQAYVFPDVCPAAATPVASPASA